MSKVSRSVKQEERTKYSIVNYIEKVAEAFFKYNVATYESAEEIDTLNLEDTKVFFPAVYGQNPDQVIIHYPVPENTVSTLPVFEVDMEEAYFTYIYPEDLEEVMKRYKIKKIMMVSADDQFKRTFLIPPLDLVSVAFFIFNRDLYLHVTEEFFGNRVREIFDELLTAVLMTKTSNVPKVPKKDDELLPSSRELVLKLGVPGLDSIEIVRNELSVIVDLDEYIYEDIIRFNVSFGEKKAYFSYLLSDLNFEGSKERIAESVYNILTLFGVKVEDVSVSLSKVSNLMIKSALFLSLFRKYRP